jgi:ribosomal protein S18 acetylase RimI-like enzyme
MVTVRSANREDIAVLARMLRDSAIDQGGEQFLCVDPENLLHDGFVLDPPRFRCLIAECDGEAAGLALYFPVYSTWVSRTALYLEDLYVAPHFRRRGVARMLMGELARIAQKENCGFIRWLVLRENTRAIRFYESLRAESAGSDSMLIEGEALAALADTPAATR